jgi:hypothetical protein
MMEEQTKYEPTGEPTKEEIEKIRSEYTDLIKKQEEQMFAEAQAIRTQMALQGKPRFTIRDFQYILKRSLPECNRVIEDLAAGGFISKEKTGDIEYYRVTTDLTTRLENMKSHAIYYDNIGTQYVALANHIRAWGMMLEPKAELKND